MTNEGMLIMGPNSRKNNRKRLQKFDHTDKQDGNGDDLSKKARLSKRVKF